MSFRFRTSTSFITKVSSTSNLSGATPGRRGWRLLAGIVLLAGAIAMMWVYGGFARYAFTGFLWTRTEGMVSSTGRTSDPTVQFGTSDGTSHVFKEDYVILCGRRSLCWIRHFNPGEVVPVVYDPAQPQRAFIYDWALFNGVITWFLMAGAGLLFALFLAALALNRPLNFSIRIGNGNGPY